MIRHAVCFAGAKEAARDEFLTSHFYFTGYAGGIAVCTSGVRSGILELYRIQDGSELRVKESGWQSWSHTISFLSHLLRHASVSWPATPSRKRRGLVLLPGGLSSSLVWRRLIAPLAGRLRTYALDAIYDVGRSVPARPVKDIDDLVGWLDGVLDQLGLDGSVHLMGLSFGDQELQSLKMPVLYVVGEHDGVVEDPRAAVARVKAVAPHIETLLIPGAGHDAIISHTRLVADRVLQFLAD